MLDNVTLKHIKTVTVAVENIENVKNFRNARTSSLHSYEHIRTTVLSQRIHYDVTGMKAMSDKSTAWSMDCTVV